MNGAGTIIGLRNAGHSRRRYSPDAYGEPSPSEVNRVRRRRRLARRDGISQPRSRITTGTAPGQNG